MSGTIIEIEYATQAWYDFLLAAKDATTAERRLSISVDVNGRGEPMIAFKIGEGMWTAHRNCGSYRSV